MSIVVPSGPLRHRVTFQAPTDAPNGRGGTTRTWLDSFTVWGEVTAVKPGTERIENDRPVAASTWNWRVRFSSQTSTVVERQRFTAPHWPGKTFEIVSITNTDGRNTELTGQAVEIDE